jgi:hypothetical protein
LLLQEYEFSSIYLKFSFFKKPLLKPFQLFFSVEYFIT